MDMSAVHELVNGVVNAVMANPNILLGLVVLVVLVFLHEDTRKSVLPLVNMAIQKAEEALDRVGREKLELAVDLVLAHLPQPYRSLVPRAMVVALVQYVFNRKWSMVLDKSKTEELLPPKP